MFNEVTCSASEMTFAFAEFGLGVLYLSISCAVMVFVLTFLIDTVTRGFKK